MPLKNNEILIRQVRMEDLDSCSEIELSCFPPTEAASLENIKKRIEIFPQGFYLAEKNGKVIGMVNSGATNKDDISDEEFKKLVGHMENGKNIVIFSLAVLPEYQKMGISKKLMQYFAKKSAKLGKEKILLICKSCMLDYYKKLDFTYIGKSISQHGGAEWNGMELLLVK